MRLIGSKTEEDYRNELIKSSNSLLKNEKETRLRNILKKHFPEMKSAYLLDWTPDQGEDFYKILVNTSVIVGIEVDRFDLDAEPIVEKMQISEYKKGLSKIGQIKLAVALDLAQNKTVQFEK